MYVYGCLGRQSEFGTPLYETLGLEGEINMAISKLAEWAAPRRVTKNLLTISDQVYIHPEPLGLVLVIGAWNYPWAVTIQPLIGAIAAGALNDRFHSNTGHVIIMIIMNLRLHNMDKSFHLSYVWARPKP